MEMAGAKGNNGRAAQARLARKLGAVLGTTLLILLAVTVTRRGNGTVRTRRRRRGRMGVRGQGGRRDGDVDVPPGLMAMDDAARGDAVHDYDDEDGIGGGGGRNGGGGGHFIMTHEERVLSARVHLVDVHVGPGSLSSGNGDTYGGGVIGDFCTLDWDLHKTDPSRTPMFRDLVGASVDCRRNRFSMDLRDVAAKARAHDAAQLQQLSNGADASAVVPRSVPLGGVVFHESRCGSTLVANSLVAADPSGHRVFSESQPPIAALRACDTSHSNYECDPKLAAELFKDVVYLMGRTDDPSEHKQFFKIQSIGTKGIGVFRTAFPDVPWIFVYRDPVQVMMSHLANVKDGKVKNANCMRSSRRPGQDIKDLVKERGGAVGKTMYTLTSEDHCALHLASICEAARREQAESHSGVMVNYVTIPDVLMTSIFPDHFGIPMTDDVRGRIEEVCTKYSKARNKGREWVDDSEKKDRKATPEVKAAAELFLQPSFDWMEADAAAGAAKLA